MTARPIRYQRQVSDRKGKIFYTSITSLSHISKIRAGIAIVHIKSGVLEPILIGVLLQDKFLRRDLSRVFSS